MSTKLFVRFLLICEGTSDAMLRRPLEDLCIHRGTDEVEGVAPDLSRLPDPPGNQIAPKLERALELEPSVDLIFVHRDSDSDDPAPRYREIETALEGLVDSRKLVAVVPVRMTEAWLVSDGDALRAITGRECETVLPNRAESLADPKKKLRELLVESSGTTGRRRDKFKSRFPKHRRRLIENLNINGPVSNLESWKRLVRDLDEALRVLRESAEA